MSKVIELFNALFFVGFIGLCVIAGIVGYSIGGTVGAVIGFFAVLAAFPGNSPEC